MKPDKCKWVGKPSPVNALVDAVKRCDFSICDFTQFQILKYIPAGTDCFPQIFVSVCPLICGFQVFSFRDKLLSQPFGRCFKVCAFVTQPVFTFFQAVFIRPIITADRRVITLKIPKLRPSAHSRL